MLGLQLGLKLGSPGDSTPVGATDVWLWEGGTAMQWEAGIFIQTN